ncbi:MAG: hypothetical protein RLP12_02555, partial [Ekhidna sp.]
LTDPAQNTRKLVTRIQGAGYPVLRLDSELLGIGATVAGMAIDPTKKGPGHATGDAVIVAFGKFMNVLFALTRIVEIFIGAINASSRPVYRHEQKPTFHNT